jgi:hypothetical protein
MNVIIIVFGFTRKHYSLYLQKYFEFARRDIDNAESKIIQFISELKKLKIDETYKEGFLLAIRLVVSELKTTIDKK